MSDYVPLHGMPEEVYNGLKRLPLGSYPNWDCRCGRPTCWECMHKLYAAYDEAWAAELANRANAPRCPCDKDPTERWPCECGNWFCNHCGDHVGSSVNKITGRICWAGCA